MTTATQLHDGNPDGIIIGQASTDLIGFYGTAGTDQAAAIATVTASTTLTGIVTALNSALVALREKGFIAT